MNVKNIGILFLSLFILGVGCAPAFSEFQGAEVVGKGNIEVTPYYSTVSMDEEDPFISKSGEAIQTHLGIQLAYGLSDKIDIRAKYEKITPTIDFGISGTVMSLGLKYKLLSKDSYIFSLYAPISRISLSMSLDLPDEPSEDDDSSNNINIFEPTMLLTVPIKTPFGIFDINPSLKMLIPLDDDAPENSLVLNLGGGYNFKSFIIRPEFGILLMEDEKYQHFGIGATYKF